MSAAVSNSSTPVPSAEPTRSRTVALHRNVLLATDGSPAALASTRFVARLAAQWPVSPRAITVVPPTAVTFDPLGANIAFDGTLEEELRLEVVRQLESSSGRAWPRESCVGTPANEIIRVAELRRSDLIVLGLRPHALLDRVFRDETALSVMRRATVPVLAITPALDRLPKRIAVAIDFSRASIAAARSALTLLDDDGSLLLTYVEPSAQPRSEETEGFSTIYAQGVAAAFARLRDELSLRTPVKIETVVLNGNVITELLSFAERADVDVIAVGSQRHSVARRAFVGSVTTALARAAERSLFVLPPRA